MMRLVRRYSVGKISYAQVDRKDRLSMLYSGYRLKSVLMKHALINCEVGSMILKEIFVFW